MTIYYITASNVNQWFTQQGGINLDFGFTGDANAVLELGDVIQLTQDVTLSTNNVYLVLPAEVTFDGQGFTIDLGSTTTNGLFETGGSSLESGSVVKNLGVLNGSLDDNTAGYVIRKEQQYFTVENCYSTGDINGREAGGIAGQGAGNNGNCTIKNCYSTGDIVVDAGGIVGKFAGNNGECTINNCYSTGGIRGTNAGGIAGRYAGYQGECTINNCYSTGNIEGIFSGGAGGIAGTTAGQNGTCTINNCYSTGIIEAIFAGGIAGRYAGYLNGTCTINNCYSTGNIEGTFAGGIAGSAAGQDSGNCTINNCYSTGDITGGSAGGITGNQAGFSNGTVTVTNSYSKRKSGNINNGTSDGSTPMDGNFNITDIENGISLDSLGNAYILDTTAPIEYPLLSSINNLYSDYINYDSAPTTRKVESGSGNDEVSSSTPKAGLSTDLVDNIVTNNQDLLLYVMLKKLTK